MAFGFQPPPSTVGYIVPTFEDLFADAQAKYIAATTANVDVENGPAADILRTVAGLFKDSWDDAKGVYDSKHITAAPGTNGVAEGSALEIQLSPKIGPKQAAAATTVVLPLLADIGPAVNVPAGQTVRIAGETGTWSLDAPVVIPGGGTIDGDWTYFETGPKLATAGLGWEIVTPVTGWASVGPNVAAGITGRNVETDAEYRARYQAALRDNLVGAVRAVPGVTSVSVFENPTGVPDSFWAATHWVELLVVGGTDAAVSAAIQAERAKGVGTVGNTTVNITDADYVAGMVTIKLSRPVLIQTFVAVTVIKGQNYPADDSAEAITARETAIKDAIAARFALLSSGNSISSGQLSATILASSGIIGIDDADVFLDTSPGPTFTGTLTPATREQLTVASVDIAVSGA